LFRNSNASIIHQTKESTDGSDRGSAYARMRMALKVRDSAAYEKWKKPWSGRKARRDAKL